MSYKYILTLVLVISACGGLPKHAETRSDNSPKVVLVEAVGAQLFIDGKLAGTAEDEHAVFAITPGTHQVHIRQNGLVIFDKKLFIQGNTYREINPSGISN